MTRLLAELGTRGNRELVNAEEESSLLWRLV
jgi:hypothetical protein